MTDRDKAIEAAARHSYIYEGDRKGCSYIGWEREPEDIKQEWRESVAAAVGAYEAALEDAGWVLMPVEPTPEILAAGYTDADKMRELYAGIIAARPKTG